MSDGTAIEWTDATWNVVNGCSHASPGCTNCYAQRLAGTRLQHHPSRAGLTRPSKAGPVWNGQVRFNDKVLLDPLHWRRPRRIFVCAHGDLFHENVPDEWIDRVFAVMAMAPQHQFQVLTKRAARMRAYFEDRSTRRCDSRGAALISIWEAMETPDCDRIFEGPWPLPNVWLGVSVEDQKRAEERIPHLLAATAAVRWLSCEPLLRQLDLTAFMPAVHHHPDNRDRRSPAMLGLIKAARDQLGGGIDWVVAGGESGPGARPMHPDWARSLREQCAAAGVPFLFKQWGEFGPDLGPDDDRDRDGFQRDRVMEGSGPCAAWLGERWQFAEDGYAMPLDLPGDDHEWVYRLGKKRNGRHLDGQLHDGFPA